MVEVRREAREAMEESMGKLSDASELFREAMTRSNSEIAEVPCGFALRRALS